jgi:DNA polymerase III alpha subunit
MPAMALCDRDGVYGAPRFFARATEAGLRSRKGLKLSPQSFGQMMRNLIAGAWLGRPDDPGL